jgi:hypothetical protein
MRFLDCHYNVLGDRALHEWQFANIFGQGDQLTASMAKRTDSMCLTIELNEPRSSPSHSNARRQALSRPTMEN